MSFTSIRTTLAAGLGAAALAGTLAAPAGAAVAQPPGSAAASPAATSSEGVAGAGVKAAARRNYYGAIAINTKTLARGYTIDAKTKYWAERGAMNRCKSYQKKQYCKKVVWVRNGCAAVAIKYDSKNRPVRYASAYGKYKQSTIDLARKRAGLGSPKGTRTHIWLCTTRYY